MGSTQFGIYIGDNNDVVNGNKVIGTRIFDGIDVCGNGNTLTSNVINSSTEAAIHLDDSCGGTGNNNVVKSNTINEACAGNLDWEWHVRKHDYTKHDGQRRKFRSARRYLHDAANGRLILKADGAHWQRPRISPYPALKP